MHIHSNREIFMKSTPISTLSDVLTFLSKIYLANPMFVYRF